MTGTAFAILAMFISEATEKNNDSVVDRAIHGNYDDKMILPYAGRVPPQPPKPRPTPPQHLEQSPPSLFSLLLKLQREGESHKAG